MRLNPGQRCGATAGSDADVYIQGRQSTESSEDTAQGEERKRAAIGEVWELLNTVCLGVKSMEPTILIHLKALGR